MKTVEHAASDIRSPLIHIGYHKTATSWLQAHFFTRRELGFHQPIPRRDINRNLIRPHTFDFDVEAARAWYNQRIAQAGTSSVELVPVLSEERFVGSPHTGGYNAGENAQRLRRVFPDARILIVIREQRSMLLSCYMQYLKEGGALNLSDYLNPRGYGSNTLPMFDPLNFQYDRLIRHYYDLFTPERVLVLTYEQFCHSPEDYLSQIAKFNGLELKNRGELLSLCQRAENKSSKYLTAPIERQVNRLFSPSRLTPTSAFPSTRAKVATRRLSKLLAKHIPQKADLIRQRMERCVKQFCRGRYEESNRRTAELTSLPLSSYNYIM